MEVLEGDLELGKDLSDGDEAVDAGAGPGRQVWTDSGRAKLSFVRARKAGGSRLTGCRDKLSCLS